MTGVIGKWGNSLALRIPDAVVRVMHFRQGSVVKFAAMEGGLVITLRGQGKISLSHLLKGITKNNQHSNQDRGGVVGREAF